MIGAAEGTGTGLRFGSGSGATLEALPMPEGSRPELLSPLTLPGPCGMPLTPASCANAGVGKKHRQHNDQSRQLKRCGPPGAFVM